MEEVWLAGAAVSISWFRMSVALLLSLAFSFTIGGLAGVNKNAERIIIPILDILQSIPILGFFPIAIYALYMVSPVIGPELAAIFLIFTSQVWNITFAVYESIRMVPTDLVEASKAMGMGRLERVFRIYIPATLPRVFQNIPPSWSNGLYFLVASEILNFGQLQVRLFGLGSLMAQFASSGNFYGMTITLAVLILAVIATNLLVFLPLMHYGERFRFETAARETRTVWVSRITRRLGIVSERLSKVEVRRPGIANYPELHRALSGITRRIAIRRSIAQLFLFAMLAYIISLIWLSWGKGIGDIFVGVVESFTQLGIEGIIIPVLFSLARVALSVAFAVAWSLPIAILLFTHRRASAFIIPLLQVIASIPATITYPIFATLLYDYDELRTFILITLGTQWYVFFSIFGGLSNTPSEELEVADLLGIKGLQRLKALYFPRIIPALITGCIAATGGAWNTLVVAERLKLDVITAEIEAPGLGKLINIATETGDVYTLLSLVAVMVIVIIVINRVFWKRLYDHAVQMWKLPE